MKTDRTMEPYFHTKVLGTFHHALAAAGQADLFTAEQMAEAVTFYLYSHPQSRTVTSDEIHLMAQAVLRDTGFSHAAELLNEHRLHRRLQRRRIEIVENENGRESMPWSKNALVDELIKKYGLHRPLARAVASAVEEKVFKIGSSQIRRSLIRELLEADTEAMLRADEQLRVTL